MRQSKNFRSVQKNIIFQNTNKSQDLAHRFLPLMRWLVAISVDSSQRKPATNVEMWSSLQRPTHI